VTKEELLKFKEILLKKKAFLIQKAQRTLSEDMKMDRNELPDEMDSASSEYLHFLTFRFRGREKTFLGKIDKALSKIEDGTFGICENCENRISLKRLEARPETTLCIRCKEDQERIERDYE
jgi:DnaK suppressor protein